MYLLGCLVCTSFVLFCHTLASSEAKPYNVLLLMTDEHTARVTGCYGDSLVQTPTFDGLAEQGVYFTANYCQNPVCVPSRVSMVGGRMPSQLGCFGNSDQPEYKNVTTLADAFINAGYRTVWLGKEHWGTPRFQKVANSEYSKDEETMKKGRTPQESRVNPLPKETSAEHQITNHALSFLETEGDKPFFLGVSFMKPHFPFTIQKEYYDLYKDKVSLPAVNDDLIASLPEVSKKEREKYNLADASSEELLRATALYYGMVTYVDEEFGRIIRKLDELGLRENTIILYTSDHGEMLGEHGIWYKNSFHEGSARVPLIWSFPERFPTGRVIDAPAMNMDIFPTLVELCDLPVVDGLEGSSLVPVMTGQDDGKNRIALSENYRGGSAGRMIRTNRWKYFFYTNGEEYLYDLIADPSEEHNLVAAPEHRRLVRQLRNQASDGWVQEPPEK